MNTEPIELSYTHPLVIDGEPPEVRARAIAQLRDLAPKLRELLASTGAMIRNAQLDSVLELCGGDPEAAGQRIAEWDESDDGAAVTRVERLGIAIDRAVAALPD